MDDAATIRETAAAHYPLFLWHVNQYTRNYRRRRYLIDHCIPAYMKTIITYVRKKPDHKISTYIGNSVYWTLLRQPNDQVVKCWLGYIPVETLGHAVSTREDPALTRNDVDEESLYEYRKIVYDALIKLKRARPFWYKVLYRYIWKDMSFKAISREVSKSNTWCRAVYDKALEFVRHELLIRHPTMTKYDWCMPHVD